MDNGTSVTVYIGADGAPRIRIVSFRGQVTIDYAKPEPPHETLERERERLIQEMLELRRKKLVIQDALRDIYGDNYPEPPIGEKSS